jgi:hypothetical protein
MNRKLYKLPFRKDSNPKWECPTCQTGHLKIVDDTFHYSWSALSQKARNHPDWDHDWIEYVYSCMLECSNCKESVSSNGTGVVDADHDYDENGYPIQGWSDFYIPKYFQPHLKLFSIPKETPEGVVKNINESFSLLFANPASASNHVRVAIEELLTSLKVKRYEAKNGRRLFISLHRRIELLPAKHSELKELCLAIKWLGNAGSHGGNQITIDDVMDAYEILDHILNELFSPKSSVAKKIAKNINKKKGPQKR